MTPSRGRGRSGSWVLSTAWRLEAEHHVQRVERYSRGLEGLWHLGAKTTLIESSVALKSFAGRFGKGGRVVGSSLSEEIRRSIVYLCICWR